MRPCCPPGRGCNAPRALGPQPCVLSLCERRGDLPESARVLARWTALQDTVPQGQARRRRHLRRAYERAREQALSHILIYPSA